ncbi:MAG: EAL domain-containing protein [Rhodocyclaceae bacterium]|nr:EAL domain-containing protein [Rhodocyclaceae bacterium]
MAMQAPIRVLHIEDSPYDRELVQHALAHADGEFVLTAACNRAQFETALRSGNFDCVLSDFNILGFTGLEVFDAVRAAQPTLPVVILTGTGSEELAVAALKRGVADYILKSPQHIRRLPATLRHVVEQTRLAADLARQQAQTALAAKVFEASGEGILITDAKMNILAVNPYFCEVTGYRPDEIVGRNSRLLKSDAHDEHFYQTMWDSTVTTGSWRGEIINRRKDGTLCTEWLSISTVKDAAGAISHYVGHFSDVAERRVMDERLHHLTQYDALTDLPNRTLLVDRLDQALSNAARFDRAVAVMTIDIARFRSVNDSFGYRTGDQVLIETAHRLADLVRSGDTVARSGADDFALILANLEHDEDVIVLAQRILDSIALPLDVGDRQLSISANIGIGLYPKDGVEAEALLKASDIALDRSRQAGSGTFRFFAKAMDADAALRLQMESDLRKAFEHDELQLHYQPQISLMNGRICGYEALLRWRHPELGQISPARFIPLAEEIGLIDRIGAWVINQACRQNKAWLDAGFPLLPMAVNVSARQFQTSDLVEIVTAALADSDLPGAGLELEITESAFLDDLSHVVKILDRIKELGVLLALDDFGTGYSSLSHLSSLPFDKIKIDQSFIRDITSNPTNAAIVNATIAMGRSLNMTVLAEGVENEAQLEFLRSRQCEAMQGWLFSKALPADQLGALIKAGNTLKIGAGETAIDTLLLVDDEPNILNALRRLLRRENYEILTAESSAIAFDLLARHRVHVVISDQRMPDMSGTEFLSRVKQLYPDTIRIVLSGHADLQSVTDAINRGAIYRYLVKPWDDDALRAQIREAFRVAHGLAHA